MNLEELKSGTPATKPWLSIVSGSLTTGALAADSFSVGTLTLGSLAVTGLLSGGAVSSGSTVSATSTVSGQKGVFTGEGRIRQLASFTNYQFAGNVTQQSGVTNIGLTATQFIGMYGVINNGATAGFQCPNSTQIDAEINTYSTSPVADGAIIQFTVINKNTLITSPLVISPTGQNCGIPTAEALNRNTTTIFIYQRTAGLWQCINA